MTRQTYTERLRRVLGGQLAPLSPMGAGTRILFHCMSCGRIWLRDGPTARVDLSEADTLQLAAELHADLTQLPRVTCRICAVVHAGMEIELDGYHDLSGTLMGIGLSFEGAEPPGAHLLVTVHNRAWLERLRTLPRAGVIVDFARTRATLTWLTTLSYPTNGYMPITPAESAMMAKDNPPGHRAPGTERWLWKGGSWSVRVLALAGVCLLTVGQGMPPDEPYSLLATISLMRLLAQIVLQGRIAGEPEGVE